MIGKEVIENEPITGSEVKEIIEEFAEKFSHELNYEQNITLNHLARFKRYSVDDCKKIREELEEKFPNLRERAIVHIIDLVPQDLDDMRMIFSKEPYNPSPEEMKEILELLEKYVVIE